jgi:hypothetical protein
MSLSLIFQDNILFMISDEDAISGAHCIDRATELVSLGSSATLLIGLCSLMHPLTL